MRIIFTGGGTAGHVNPNLALIDVLSKKGWQISYLGGKESIEEHMIKARGIPFYRIRSGKLRRYFSWQNFIDPFNLILGVIQAFQCIRQLRPNIVFSKGGFAALPVVIGAWLNRVPVIAHESDLTPGLANRLSLPFVAVLCVTFEGSKQYLRRAKNVIVTGTPLRPQLFSGSKEKGLAYCGFQSDKLCLLVMGGSQGALAINACIREALPRLTPHFQVIHLCGKGRLNPLLNQPGYFQLEYAEEELGDFMAAADIVISRAGANALYEILACQKPHILIPLPTRASRGDQIHNARYFEKQGISVVIPEEAFHVDTLLATLEQLSVHRQEVISKIQTLEIHSATASIIKLIERNMPSSSAPEI